MIKRADLAAYLLTRQLVDGQFVAGVQELDLTDDAMDFSTRGDGLTDALIDRLEQLKAGIVEGSITVPTTPTGELLELDRLPDGFDEAFADLSHEQILDYFDGWLAPTHPEAVDDACGRGTMNRCGQLMLDHLDEWRATTDTPSSSHRVDRQLVSAHVVDAVREAHIWDWRSACQSGRITALDGPTHGPEHPAGRYVRNRTTTGRSLLATAVPSAGAVAGNGPAQYQGLLVGRAHSVAAIPPTVSRGLWRTPLSED